MDNSFPSDRNKGKKSTSLQSLYYIGNLKFTDYIPFRSHGLYI